MLVFPLQKSASSNSVFLKREDGNLPPKPQRFQIVLGGRGDPEFPNGGWFDKFIKKFIKTSQYFLPTRKEYREAFIGDLLELYEDMRMDGYNRMTIFFAIAANIASFFMKAMNGKEGSQIEDRK